jgi:hypothetical protein
VDKRGTNWENFPLFKEKNGGVSQHYFLFFLCIFQIKINEKWKKFLKNYPILEKNPPNSSNFGKNTGQLTNFANFSAFLLPKVRIYWFCCHICENPAALPRK